MIVQLAVLKGRSCCHQKNWKQVEKSRNRHTKAGASNREMPLVSSEKHETIDTCAFRSSKVPEDVELGCWAVG